MIQGWIDDPLNAVKYFLTCNDNAVMVKINFLVVRYLVEYFDIIIFKKILSLYSWNYVGNMEYHSSIIAGCDMLCKMKSWMFPYKYNILSIMCITYIFIVPTFEAR